MHMHMHTPCTCHAPGAQPAAAPRCGLTLTPTLALTLTLALTPTLTLTHQALKLPPLLAAAGGAWVYRGTGSTVIERNRAAEESAPLDSLGLLAEAAKLLALLCFMVRVLA